MTIERAYNHFYRFESASRSVNKDALQTLFQETLADSTLSGGDRLILESLQGKIGEPSFLSPEEINQTRLIFLKRVLAIEEISLPDQEALAGQLSKLLDNLGESDRYKILEHILQLPQEIRVKICEIASEYVLNTMSVDERTVILAVLSGYLEASAEEKRKLINDAMDKYQSIKSILIIPDQSTLFSALANLSNEDRYISLPLIASSPLIHNREGCVEKVLG